MSRMFRIDRLAAALTLAAAMGAPTKAAELIMLQEHGCGYCLLWERQVGSVYDKTAEGRRVPLRRLDMHEPLPDDLQFLVKGRYTPTFIVVDGGREVGRIRGYPGEDFFWGLLSQLIERLPPDVPIAEPAETQ